MKRGSSLRRVLADEEVIRRVRRAVHTLKGDSAACGFHKLSEFAHELEDILTTQVTEKPWQSRFMRKKSSAAAGFLRSHAFLVSAGEAPSISRKDARPDSRPAR